MIGGNIKTLFSSDLEVGKVMNLIMLLSRNKIQPTAEIMKLYENYEGSNDAFIREIKLNNILKQANDETD